MSDEELNKDTIDGADQTGVNNNTTGDNADSNKSTESAKTEKTEKTFTQRQVSAMMSKEKKQGRDAAFREMGIDPEDSKMVSMFKAFIESQKTDEQKANEIAAEQAAKIAEAEERAKIAEAKAEAMQLGVLPQYADDAITLALSKSGNSDIKTVIEELKTKYPIWFNKEENNDSGSVGQKGTGSSVKKDNKGGSDNENKGLGARLAAQRRTQSTAGKKSFWS